MRRLEPQISVRLVGRINIPYFYEPIMPSMGGEITYTEGKDRTDDRGRAHRKVPNHNSVLIEIDDLSTFMFTIYGRRGDFIALCTYCTDSGHRRNLSGRDT